MTVLLDTNVLSELLTPAPAPAVLAWFAAQHPDVLYVSSVTQAEMLLGARLLPAGKRRDALQTAMRAMFEEEFAGRILPFDSAAASLYAELVQARRSSGRPISQFDAQIAATALKNRNRLATRNLRDFEDCSVKLINPWE